MFRPRRYPGDPGACVMRVFGANLARARRARGVTAAELCRRARMSPNKISEFEQGRREPTPGDADRIAKALGMTAADLQRPHDPAGGPPGAQEDPRYPLWAAVNRLKGAAARAAKSPGADPAALYAAAAAKVDEVTASLDAPARP